MNSTLPKGVHIPLQVIYEGEPVSLDTAEALRRVRSYFDAWIGIYDTMEKLPQLAPQTSTPNTNALVEKPSTASPQHTIDYIVLALQTLGDPLPLKAVYHHILTLGWSTSSPDITRALRNLENTARNHKDLVTLHKGTVRLVKSG